MQVTIKHVAAAAVQRPERIHSRVQVVITAAVCVGQKHVWRSGADHVSSCSLPGACSGASCCKACVRLRKSALIAACRSGFASSPSRALRGSDLDLAQQQAQAWTDNTGLKPQRFSDLVNHVLRECAQTSRAALVTAHAQRMAGRRSNAPACSHAGVRQPA